MDSFMQPVVDFTVPGIKTIVTSHLEIFFRDMLDEQLNKINSGKGLSDESVIFMSVVMEGHVLTIIGINPGKGDDGAAKVAADIPDNRVWVAEIRLCINIKAVFIFMGFFLNLGYYKKR